MILRAAAAKELSLREVRRLTEKPRGGLIEFVREFWHVVEPVRELQEGWVLDAICEHLEAVTDGRITRLLINVPPGSMKSLLCNVFWPAWMWGPRGYDNYRILSFSYAAHLTERDNEKFRDILQSQLFRDCWPSVRLVKAGATRVKTARQGSKMASSVGGVVTGERGDIVVLDDPHNVAEGESEVVRQATVEWFRTAMSNRLNDLEKSAIVVIMQRVHEGDVSGCILSDFNGEYTHLMIPAEYDPGRHCVTSIGWEDPRMVEGETFWPSRFPKRVLNNAKTVLGKYGYAGQYQQTPEPKGGGIIRRDHWQLWEHATFPPMTTLVASLDTAYTEKQENDMSALTLWGLFEWSGFYGEGGEQLNAIVSYQGERMSRSNAHLSSSVPQLMLMYAWAERLEFPELVDKVHATCKKFKVETLLIEAKAAGHSVAQELRRRASTLGFSVHLIDPKGQDKVARAHSVVPFFDAKQVWAPDRSWADMVINQCARFPKGEHDDAVDSVTQALRWMRVNALLTSPEEIDEDEREAADWGQAKLLPPIYPTAGY